MTKRSGPEWLRLAGAWVDYTNETFNTCWRPDELLYMYIGASTSDEGSTHLAEFPDSWTKAECRRMIAAGKRALQEGASETYPNEWRFPTEHVENP